MVNSTTLTQGRREIPLSDLATKAMLSRNVEMTQQGAGQIPSISISSSNMDQPHGRIALKYAIIFGTLFAAIFCLPAAIATDVVLRSYDNRQNSPIELKCKDSVVELALDLTPMELQRINDRIPLDYAVLRCINSGAPNVSRMPLVAVQRRSHDTPKIAP